MNSWFRLAVLYAVGLIIITAGRVSAAVDIQEIVYTPRITGSHGILETADGTVYMCDSYGGTDTVYRIDTGTPVAVASGFNCPTGMWQDATATGVPVSIR